VFVWCHSVVHQTHGRIPDKFGVQSESGANGISREFPEQMKIFSEILFGGLLARIAEYSLNGSPREVKFHRPLLKKLLRVFCNFVN
jgi:hypothetical protein